MRPIILPLCAVVAVVCQLHLKGEMGSPTGIVAAAAAVAAQPAAFIPVEGANLKAKLAAAAEQARRRTQPTRFWTAYSFDVRPGVAIDAQVDNFRGHMNQIGSVGGTTILIGTSNGVAVETRNLAVFLLREPGGEAVTRMEIYNLDRRREYSGYPVYWLGRAGNQESLDLLKGLVESNQRGRVAEVATVAVGVHDDPRAAALLKDFVRSSLPQKVRTTAVFWLGQVGGEQPFLAGLVRDGRESLEVRKQAAFAIGISKDAAALATLEGLYQTSAGHELKNQIIFAASLNDNKDQALAFLVRVARTDPDQESRKQAVFWLGQHGDESAVDELMKIYEGDQGVEVKKQVMFALSQHASPRARTTLAEIARAAGADPEVRKQAVFWLGQKGDESSVDELMKVYEGDSDTELKKQVLFAFSQMHNQRAQSHLFEVARAGASTELRRQAVFWLGQGHKDQAVDSLTRLYDGEQEEAVKEHIIFSLSQTGAKQALRKLIEIAKNDSSYEMRKKALFWLGQSGDPEAARFLQELVK